jgi:hypothetical protein
MKILEMNMIMNIISNLMKRISELEAHNYISVEEDFTGSDPVFFTLKSNPVDPEWDDVVYYTARKKNVYENMEGEGDSWIYILTNKTMPNLVKIGFTNKTPDKRAKQISRSTGVPLEFNVAYAFKCFNAHAFEGELHKYLKGYRINNDREFFQISINEAKDAVLLLGKRYIKS